MQLFNGYTPQTLIYEGLMDRASAICNAYQQYTAGELTTPVIEVGPLCGLRRKWTLVDY
jgi:CRISPR-associated exonuclease Cas4